MIYIARKISLEIKMLISKWGNSLAVRLPKTLVDELGLKEGDELNVVAARNGTIAVETKEERRRRALENMRARKWTSPPDYKFDREEANER
jgi:antitoxin MazE